MWPLSSQIKSTALQDSIDGLKQYKLQICETAIKHFEIRDALDEYAFRTSIAEDSPEREIFSAIEFILYTFGDYTCQQGLVVVKSHQRSGGVEVVVRAQHNTMQ
jgi:hypothetical protein